MNEQNQYGICLAYTRVALFLLPGLRYSFNGYTDDSAADGVIVDQGGLGVPGGGAAGIPTLSEWALLLLAGLMGLFGLGAMRRRASL